jgi:hypothetical protein
MLLILLSETSGQEEQSAQVFVVRVAQSEQAWIFEVGLLIEQSAALLVLHCATCFLNDTLGRGGIPFHGWAKAWIYVRASFCHQTKLQGTTQAGLDRIWQMMEQCLFTRTDMVAASDHANSRAAEPP